MSFSVKGGIMRNTVRLGEIADRMTVGIQAATAQVAQEGLGYMRSISPVDEGDLVAHEESGSNQYAVWFRAKVAPKDDGKQYGPPQNYGWHDHAGIFHPGHFYMERTEAFAHERLAALITLAVASGMGGSLGTVGGVGFSPDLLFGGIGRILRTANPDGISSVTQIDGLHG